MGLPGGGADREPVDGRLLAAVVAAVAACLGKPAESFRVRDIRPAGGGPNLWGLAGRQAQMLARTMSTGRRKGL